MYFFTVALLSVAVIAPNLVLIQCHEEDIMTMKKQAVAQCSAQHNVSNEAVKNIINHVNVSNDPEFKCWLGCVLEKLGVIKEGEIDWERCKFLTKHCLTNDEDKAKVDKMTEICQVEVAKDEKDKCQLAYTAAVCKINYWKQFGLPIGDGEKLIN